MKSRQPVTVGPVTRANIGTDPNFLAAQRLQQSGVDLQATDIPSGLNKALSQILGSYQQKQVKDDYAARDKSYGEDVSHALGFAMGTPQETDTKTGITWNEQKPNMGAAARLLMGNQDTSDMGLKLGLRDIEQRSAEENSQKNFERDLALRKASHPQAYMNGPLLLSPVEDKSNQILQNMQDKMPQPGAESLKPPPLPMANGVIDLPPQDDANDFAENPNSSLNGSNGPVPHQILSGDDFLKTIDPQKAAIVKLIGDGREKSSTILSRMKPEDKREILFAVNQYNPNYSANNFSGNAFFNQGKGGDRIRSFSAAISHISSLGDIANALSNGNIPLLNALSNEYSRATGSPKVTNFNSAKQFVADEVVKAIVGGVTSLGDREEAAKNIRAMNSPQQLAGYIETVKDLMGGQLDATKQQYINSTKKGEDDFNNLLDQDVKEFLSSRNSKQKAPKEGSIIDNPQTGESLIMRNGQWVPYQ